MLPIKTKKEEPIAPPFLYQDVILAVTAAIYAGGGFGQKFTAEAAFILTALLILVNSPKWGIIVITGIIGLCLYEPALIQSPPLLGAILLYGKKPKHAILVLLGSALQLIGGFNPFYLPIILIPGILLASWAWAPKNKLIQITALLLLAVGILPTLAPQKSPLGHQGFAFPYRIEIAKRPDTSQAKSTYTSIDDHGDYESAQVMVLEHDPPHGIATHNWSQSRLWTENQYFGAPLLRIATGLDGFLYSNLGCRVDGPRLRLLGEGHRTEHNSIISKKSGQLVFSDSDGLNNGAVGYQKNLADALFQRFSIAHGILLGTTACFILTLWPRTKVIALPLMATVLLTVCIANNFQNVDIRICDTKAPWPHSKGIGGIGSDVSDESGIKTVSRSGRAQILGIARNANGLHRNEKVIVMEGGSSVKIGQTIYEALDLPMGDSNGIIDAIPIRRIGSDRPGKCLQKSGGILLIGTNSAKSNSKTIYDAAK
jgi:hypothetical protein